MENHQHPDTEQEDLLSLLNAQYSEACQSFVLRDFESTTGIIHDLLERIERDNLGLSKHDTLPSELDELVRRVWVLYITLIASADDELAGNAKQAESELAGAHSRIERFYARHSTTPSSPIPTPSSSTSTASTIIHPSLLVAISLAGLKLDIPSFVQRTLQEYFRTIISNAAAATSSPLSASQGDISTLDVSHADLSLSGIAVNGHAPNGHGVNGVNGHNGHTVNGTGNTAATKNNKKKSLHRLSRLYSINLLGKTLGEWSTARAWIRDMADDDGAIAAGLISDSYAQTLLDALEEAKAQQEEEEREAKQAEKSEKERQAESKKAKRSGISTNSSRQVNGEASSSNGVNGHSASSPPTRPERSKERAGAAPSAHEPSSSSLPVAEQETGFAAFRSHLSSFLSVSSESSSSLSKRPSSHLNNNSDGTSLDMLRIYLSRFVHSKLLRVLLAFFLITGFWRRRLARRGGGGGGIRLEIGKRLTMLKEKVVETVKMGGSLGFL